MAAYSVVGAGFICCSGHWEYAFDITQKCSGYSWRMQKRFSDLLNCHKKLSHLSANLPPFPPNGFPGLGLLMGQDYARARAEGLDYYFACLIEECEDVMSSLEFQEMLGVQRPSSKVLQSVTAKEWHLAESSESGESIAHVELEVALSLQQGPGLACPVDRLLATASAGTSIIEVEAALTGIPALLRVEDLPCGTDAVLEVRVANAVGESDAFVICLQVPGHSNGTLAVGTRVRAVWAEDGCWYDAVVNTINQDDSVVVDWLRPSPLTGIHLVCVCEAGGDDTSHRCVLAESVELVDTAEEDTARLRYLIAEALDRVVESGELPDLIAASSAPATEADIQIRLSSSLDMALRSGELAAAVNAIASENTSTT